MCDNVKSNILNKYLPQFFSRNIDNVYYIDIDILYRRDPTYFYSQECSSSRGAILSK